MADSEQGGLQDNVLAGSLIKTAFMLLVVVSVILVLAWLVRKSQMIQKGNHKSLNILESIQLGRHERICIVQAGEAYLLIGVTANGINKLHEFTPDQLTRSERPKQVMDWAHQLLNKKHSMSTVNPDE